MNNYAFKTVYDIGINQAVNATVYTIDNNLMYIGDYKFSAANNDLGNWLLCDGRSLLISEYSQLYDIISDSFGSEDSEHFNIPDFRGRVFGAIGSGNNLSVRNLGETIGTEDHTLTVQQIPSHNHTADVSGEHIHSITDPGHIHTGTTDASGIHTHTSNAIGGQGNYGLVTADGSNTVIDTDGSNGELNVWTVPGALNINNNGSHTHTFTSNSSVTGIANTNSSGTHTHTINNTGGGQSHNNMQPTLFAGSVFILSKIGSYLY